MQKELAFIKRIHR